MSRTASMLADKVYRFSMDAIGSPDHIQIAEQIRAADRYRIELESARRLRDTIDRFPWAVEQNVDVLAPPVRPMWIEWPLETRAGHGGGADAVTGCLVLAHPDVDTVTTFITAWIGEKKIARHSYGTASVSQTDLALNAFNARKMYSEDAEESITRIMDHISLAVPLGFQDEIGIMFDWSEGAMEGIYRDSSGEMPFILTALLAMQAKGGLVGVPREGHTELSFGEPSRPGVVASMTDRILRRPPSPIRRVFRGGSKVDVLWEATPEG